MKKFILAAFVIVSLSSNVFASGGVEKPKQLAWQFSGVTGKLDRQAAQRGFQVYSNVCSNCHAMKRISYRNLAEIGFTEEEIKALSASKLVDDLDDKGEKMQRPGKPFDAFVSPYPNELASRAANGGAYPPDLSLMVKARPDGANYIYSLITGYSTAPEEAHPVKDKYYNPYFAGHWISMPPPLADGAVTYQDGTTASLDQMAKDVVVFLQWAAEPEMEQRKQLGLKVMIFLGILTTLLYLIKRRIWRNIKH
jgi:ubiquinol-cytochrome c reductase cytochrome c1 subunit